MKLKLEAKIEYIHTHIMYANLFLKKNLRNLCFTNYLGEYLKGQIGTEMGVYKYLLTVDWFLSLGSRLKEEGK